MVPELITRLDRWLVTNRPEYYAQLRPGVTDVELDSVEARFGLSLPVSFRHLYQWRDGQDGYDSIQHNRMFMPLESVISTKELNDGFIGNDFPTLEWWRREWVPFLENGAGDCLVIDLLGINGGRPGQVVTFWHDWDNRAVEFPSLDAWLQDLVESMESGELELV